MADRDRGTPEVFDRFGAPLLSWDHLPESSREAWWKLQVEVMGLQAEQGGEGPETPWGRRGVLQTLTVTTRLPGKWLLIDRETGDQWEHRDGRWKRAREPQEGPVGSGR